MTVLTGNQITDFRTKMLLRGIKAELRGMRLTSRGPSCYSIIKKEYGLKGNKQKVHDQFEKIVKDMGL